MKKFVCFLAVWLCIPFTLRAQNDLDVIRNWIQFSDAPNSLYHHLANQAYALLGLRSGHLASITSLDQWKRYQGVVKKKLLEVVGPFPERTPLNPKITKTLHKDTYKVENIIFESQPQFYVTASIFIPNRKTTTGKLPAIIYCSGHTDDGYRNPVYQQAILNLVNKGFIVFAFDPIGQGERFEYFDARTAKPLIGERDEEHSYAGVQPLMIGSSLARYMIWDGIRAIDYLVSRTEVDSKRIGITGRSGGGTQSAYIAALDDRIKAVAPGNYITNFKRLIQSAGPQCAEQDFFCGIKQGLDIPDLLISRAPKPALVVATTRDQIFSIQGAVEAAREVDRIYKAYGKEADFKLVTADAVHASTAKGRQAIYAFFQKYLDNPGSSNDETIELLTPEQLRVTPTGQLSTSLGGQTVYSLNKKAAEEVLKNVESKRRDTGAYFKSMLSAARTLSGFRTPQKGNHPVFNGRFQRQGYVVEKYFIGGEGNYVLPYLLLKPGRPNGRALVYLNPRGKSADASEGGKMEWFVKNGFTVLAPDLPGFGELGPGIFRGDSYIQGVSYNIWFLSMLVGRSIVGIQAGDLIRLINELKRDKNIEEIYGLADGEMSPVLLHAAAFDSSIKRILLIEPYLSYHSVVTSRFYSPAYVHSVVPGALQSYDLPGLMAVVAPEKLYMVNVRAGTGDFVEEAAMDTDLSFVDQVYRRKNRGDHFRITRCLSRESLNDFFYEWIK